METVKIFSDNNLETVVNGIFYVFNSKYYFMHTTGEMDDNEYVRLYVSQVCKEIKNTPTGPIDTGYMLGMEITNSEEWLKVQESITKIVNDKKTGTQSEEIQYLPMSMLVNFKIVGKNKFKLMKNIVEENFKVNLSMPGINQLPTPQPEIVIPSVEISSTQIQQPEIPQQKAPGQTLEQQNSNVTDVDNVLNSSVIAGTSDSINANEVIIDYRTRFFEEQEKNKELEEKIKKLNEKIDNIRNIIG